MDLGGFFFTHYLVVCSGVLKKLRPEVASGRAEGDTRNIREVHPKFKKT